MPYCTKCGTFIKDKNDVCPNCNPYPNNVGSLTKNADSASNIGNTPVTTQPIQPKPVYQTTRVSALAIISFILGICGLFYTVFRIINDAFVNIWYRYTYLPPYTEHEIIVIAIGLVSLLFTVLGACNMVKKVIVY